MSRRPESIETVQLAVELLRRIPRKPRKVTATDLHAQLQDAGIRRELRTVQRQLKTLAEHFDVECDDSSKPYGYCWKPQARGLSVLGLNAQESLLLSLAEQHLRNLLPSRVMGAMEAFFTQARSNLAYGEQSPREREWLEKVRVVSTTQPLLPPKIDESVFNAVTEALYANRWLDIAYRNRSGRELEKRVMPLALAQQGVQLYLVCRFEGYDDERSLALHRFQRAEVSTMGFQRPQDFNLRRYDNEGRFGYGHGERIRLSFHIEREAGLHLLEARLAEDQQVQESDSGYHITATVVDSGQLDWWLNSFGDAVSGIDKPPLQ